jgi:hypothetical protein
MDFQFDPILRINFRELNPVSENWIASLDDPTHPQLPFSNPQTDCDAEHGYSGTVLLCRADFQNFIPSIQARHCIAG